MLFRSPTKVQKRNKEEVKKEAEELLEKVGLSEKSNSYPRQLSGGQKQRVMNSVLFIVFEVINYKTGKPLAKDDVGATAENYNLLSVEKYQFFDEEKPCRLYTSMEDYIKGIGKRKESDCR